MQEMLTICEYFCAEFCLSFNVRKSKALLFGKWPENVSPLLINNQPVEYITEWKYLGCTIVAGKNLSFSVKSHLRSFYCSVNSLLGTVQRPNELVMMKLLYSNCVPALTYAADIRDMSSSDMNQCNVALNGSIWKIFSYNRWESTRYLRQQLGYQNVTEIFYNPSNSFSDAAIASL